MSAKQLNVPIDGEKLLSYKAEALACNMPMGRWIIQGLDRLVLESRKHRQMTISEAEAIVASRRAELNQQTQAVPFAPAWPPQPTVGTPPPAQPSILGNLWADAPPAEPVSTNQFNFSAGE